MEYKTIEEIYTANEAIRKKFKDTVASLTDDQIAALPEGEKWSIAQIVEHVSMVDEGMMRICAKLLGKAEAAGMESDGTAAFSNNFLEKGPEIARIKIEAPDFVRPVSGRSIKESLEKLDESQDKFNELRTAFETFNGSEFKFPHPFFGDISAQEWLAIGGGHEARHLRQIKNLLEKIGQ